MRSTNELPARLLETLGRMREVVLDLDEPPTREQWKTLQGFFRQLRGSEVGALGYQALVDAMRQGDPLAKAEGRFIVERDAGQTKPGYLAVDLSNEEAMGSPFLPLYAFNMVMNAARRVEGRDALIAMAVPAAKALLAASVS